MVLGDSAYLLNQNTQNSTVAPLMSCVSNLPSSVYSTVQHLPGVPQHEAESASQLMADAAFDTYYDEVQSVDAQLNAESLQTLRQQDHNFGFLLADKNPGLLFVMCTVYWAGLFCIHMLNNVKYRVLYSFCAVFMAKNLLKNTIIEQMSSSGVLDTWHPVLGARWNPSTRNSQARSAKLLIKSKSKEAEGLIQIRNVISRFRHPASKIGKVVSRALSLLYKVVGDLDANFEFLSMYDEIMQWVSYSFFALATRIHSTTHYLGHDPLESQSTYPPYEAPNRPNQDNRHHRQTTQK